MDSYIGSFDDDSQPVDKAKNVEEDILYGTSHYYRWRVLQVVSITWLLPHTGTVMIDH